MDNKYYEELYKMKIIGKHVATPEELDSAPAEQLSSLDYTSIYDDLPPVDKMNHLLLFNMAKDIRTIKQIIIACLVISIISAIIVPLF